MPIAVTKPPDQLSASKNDAWISVGTSDANTFIQMEVYSMPVHAKIATLIAPLNDDGIADFNLKRILQSMGTPDSLLKYQLPTFNQLAPSPSTNNIKLYSLFFTSIDRTTGQQISTLDYNNNNMVLLSGKNFLYGNTDLLSIIGTGTTKRKFLTYHPQEKRVVTTSQEYLFYYHNETGISTGAVSVSILLTIYFNDGSTAVQTILPFTISDKQIVIYPVGFSQLNLSQYETGGKIISRYDVALTIGATIISETKTYNVDRRCFVNSKEFIFLNSLSGMDTLLATDTTETGMEILSETSEHFLPNNYTPVNGQYYNFYRDNFRSQKCTTDLLLYDERIYLQEFFISLNTWEIGDANFIPIILTDSNVTLNKDRKSLQNIQFAFRYAFDDIAYTHINF